ncbi:MAG: MBL fold metallo-hydrolase [Candidatus Cloacimonetes bacterium]|nr:MBL fold metallo-hydrolase [Candidatus Cloacimonadota bacterium]
MFKVSVLASGSKGNSTVVCTDSTMVLLDAGLSGKKILNLLSSINLDATKLNAVIISHEHHDHINGAGIICRKLNIPLYITRMTYLASQKYLGKLPEGVVFFENGNLFKIGNIEVKTFPSSHDVVDGSNFVFEKTGDKIRKLALATDLGFSSKLMLHRIKESTSIVLESNHDVKMLMNGPYPPYLKQRIKSKQGHLSNEQAVGVITRVVHPGLKNLVLAHLSEQNNLPETAENIMKEYLQIINHDLQLFVSSQYEATPLIDI